MSDKSIIDQIKHYQRDIVKSPDDSKRMIRCIERLTVLPVTIAHLQETGVGRSVNELRKCGGEVGAAANALVSKWKNMVVREEDEDEEESSPESDVEVSESKDYSSPPRKNDIDKKPKPVSNIEDSKKSASSQSPNKRHESRSDSRSSRSSDHRPSSKSEYKSHKNDSAKSGYSSNSDSKLSSSHKSKTEHDSRLHKKPHSSHKSESEINGKVSKDKSHSKERLDHNKSSKSSPISSGVDSKNKDIKQKYSKDKYRAEEYSHKNSTSSSKKYDLKKIDSDTSDDENIYKPSNKKRKKSDSEEEQKYSSKYQKKPFDKEFLKKRRDDSSEESVVDESDSDEDDRHANGGSVGADSRNNSESEMSNRTEDNPSDNEANSGDRSSSHESDHERNQSERNSDSGGSAELSETEEYVPVKIKREKESPPKYSKSSDSEKKKSSSGKSSHNSSSNSKHHSSSFLAVKKEKDHEDFKIKKEKVDKDSVRPHKQKEVNTSSDKRSHKSSSSHSGSSSKHNNKIDSKVKVKIEKKEDGSIDCESGASFGDALLGLSGAKKKSVKRKPSTPSQEKSPKPYDKSISKPKSSSKSEPRPSSSSLPTKLLTKEPDLLSKSIKLEPLDVDLKSTLPEITPHYKPLPHYSPPSSPVTKRSKLLSEEEALSNIMSQKNQRTKVYSGNKTGYTKVPSLFDLCIQVLRDNIEALEYTGGVPYDLLKPVLDRATADQLYQLEHYNPYLIGDTDTLWQFHCNKDFRGKKPDEYETWRELYLRLLDERERKLEALKANITQSMAKSTPIRQTKLAYVDSVVKPPRNVARKQIKFGTQKAVKHDLVAKAMVGAAGATSSSPAPDVVPVPSPASSRSSSAFPIPNFIKKKKAPLMAKALQLIKGNRFKR